MIENLFSADGWLNQSITSFNNVMLTYVVLALLIGCALWFNLIAIVYLGKHAFFLLDDYIKQKRKGIKSSTFHRSQMPEIENEIECWD